MFDILNRVLQTALLGLKYTGDVEAQKNRLEKFMGENYEKIILFIKCLFIWGYDVVVYTV